MTDRELLGLAAKAAGFQFSEYGGGARYDPKPGIIQPYVRWNPLEDDGDALRLAVKLQMRVGIGEGGDSVLVQAGFSEPFYIAQHGCDEAATRRAIVRAAAEIGKEPK